MRPSPTSLLPAQMKTAPSPDRGPSNVALALGSSFAQGDQASQLWKSFTCANTRSGGGGNGRGACDSVFVGLQSDDDEEDDDQSGETEEDFLDHGVCPRLETLPETMRKSWPPL